MRDPKSQNHQQGKPPAWVLNGLISPLYMFENKLLFLSPLQLSGVIYSNPIITGVPGPTIQTTNLDLSKTTQREKKIEGKTRLAAEFLKILPALVAPLRPSIKVP